MNSKVTASVTAGCSGATKWSISGTKYKGTSNCNNNNGCPPTALFSYTAGIDLPVGTYTVSANFDNGHGVNVARSSSFSVVSSQITSGDIYPASLSVVALAFFVLKKQGKDSARRTEH
ncbi:MAG: hypothetical protein JRM99_02500 [Nitrososphaerota archaeon]|nr:hypothetical protein [Nitrososphaerota archaeon]